MTHSAGSVSGLTLSIEQLEQALTLARRSHDGTATLQAMETASLDWVRVDVLLTDMGKDDGPLHTFYMTPRGVLRSS
jgi:hypothetical protein